ncbi:NitT/TauT family transport system ATP-binding protein [Stackebrandtia albiflava]|uniref:NitT/TauT family transport system ATP-binding protein n=1 Tax=Stackebrandtia albiflava TaxID=406432 RepID=A0A562VCC4_9ACTN|nr:ABC transporter ATP-binding protein [Stackebrandtia albiflava]TWJ15529.1 NitT/TauT family transport system ATP-binding protein [Stackebrandtia albiflava]
MDFTRPGGIVVDGVGLTFHPPRRDSVVALENVDLTVSPGEFVCVVGASGSGKSTLLRLLDGLITPTTGTITAGGEPVTGPSPDRAMVFQSDNLMPWSTVVDNVAYGLVLGGMKRARARQIATTQLERVGLADAARLYPRQLSGGMRQRVNIARALAVDPQVLLLDEPFAALDAQTREIMSAELLRIWSADRKTVVFITHQIDEAVFLADRVVVLSARPGTVREIVPVDFARPRDLSLKRTPEFGRVVDHIWSLIEDEVRGSLGLH